MGNKETEWKNILDKANIGATTKSNLATSVDQILNLPNSSNYSPPSPNEESIEGFEERILQKHQEMKEQAKQEYGHPDKFKHVKGAPITHLCPEDLPLLPMAPAPTFAPALAPAPTFAPALAPAPKLAPTL